MGIEAVHLILVALALPALIVAASLLIQPVLQFSGADVAVIAAAGWPVGMACSGAAGNNAAADGARLRRASDHGGELGAAAAAGEVDVVADSRHR
ncbi:hypothetical protein [Actinoplanes cyaneus]|uniref:hypothetical protein n=1 Tax=Actinoplanes cyaneus TaxID=52696 RepID=UPI001942EC1D|nr:hypothetical protein [Actinoplanes cyaneus]